jgi:AI-2 transport system permease protein
MKIPAFIKSWEVALIGLLVVEVMVFSNFSRAFTSVENLLFSTSDFAHIMLASLAMTMVIITGGIDISVASVMGLSSIVLGVTWQAGANIFVAMGIALAVGILAGVINGLLVANTDINPLVITLGTNFLYAGIATGIAGSLVQSAYEGISGLPREFTRLALGSLGPVPYSLIIIVVLVILYSILLHKTRFGRSLYLIGVNEAAARYSGVQVKAVKVGAYALSGFGAALAGTMLTAYFTSARSDLGAEALLPVITAVVLGGTNILGGSGTIVGTFLAALFLGYLKQGLLAMGITSDVSQVVVGVLLVSVVAIKLLVVVLNQNRLNRRALRMKETSKGGI